MKLPKEARIIIIEGIPGAGKNTLHQEIKDRIGNRKIYDFHEEELLFSWKHAWIRDIEKIRLTFMNRLLDYCEKILKEKDALFIFNRFHISLMVIAVNMDAETVKGYKKLVNRLKKLPVHIFVPILDKEEIEGRAIHRERTDEIWQLHLKKRLRHRGYSRLEDMYAQEQDEILKLLKKQGIPFSTVRINTNR